MIEFVTSSGFAVKLLKDDAKEIFYGIANMVKNDGYQSSFNQSPQDKQTQNIIYLNQTMIRQKYGISPQRLKKMVDRGLKEYRIPGERAVNYDESEFLEYYSKKK